MAVNGRGSQQVTEGEPASTDDDWRTFSVWQVLAGYVGAVLAAGITGALGAALSGDGDSLTALLAGQVGFWSVLVGVVALGRRRSAPRADAERSTRQLRWVDLAGLVVGVFTQLVLLPLLYLPFRALIDDDELSKPAEELLSGIDGAGLVAMGIGVVLVAPIVEELFFRGLLFETMRRRWGTRTAVVASSLFFGATHFQPLQFAGLTLAGLVFAAAVVRTGRLGTAIAVHAGFNATTFVALVML